MATAPTTGDTARAKRRRTWNLSLRSGLARRGRAERRRALGRRREDKPARRVRSRRRPRLIDLLRALGLARRAVPRPVVGPKAYTQWWQRLRALIVLVVLVAGIGFALAAAVGIMVVVAGFLLEQAIS